MSFTTIVTLTIKDNDDFRRVLTFVQSEKGEVSPDSDDEYKQMIRLVLEPRTPTVLF